MWAFENVHPKHSKVGPLQVQNGVVSYGPYFGGSSQDLQVVNHHGLQVPWVGLCDPFQMA